MEQTDDTVYIGVDFGGTTITAGAVVNREIQVLKTVPTRRERPPGEILETIAGVVREVAGGDTVGGVGIGVPCPSGPGVDKLVMIENLPAMEGYPLRPLLEERLGMPVALENDAKCMALGEYAAGALRGCNSCACVTLGTGLGCGIIIGGALYRGKGSFSGEIWNIPLETGGVLEDTVSIGGLKQIARARYGKEIEPHILHKYFVEGDARAVQVFETFGERVGRVMVMLLSVLDPERIALGGGLSRAFGAFRGGMRRVIERTWGEEGAERIVHATLSDHAAVLGAAEAVKKTVQSPKPKIQS